MVVGPGEQAQRDHGVRDDADRAIRDAGPLADLGGGGRSVRQGREQIGVGGGEEKLRGHEAGRELEDALGRERAGAGRRRL